MEPSTLLLAQGLTLSGLIGASGAYAGLIRRRHDRRIASAVAMASEAAIDRVERALVLGRIDHTFIRSAYLPHRRYPGARRR